MVSFTPPRTAKGVTMSKQAVAILAAFIAASAPAAYAEEEATPYDFSLDTAGADTPEGAARIYADIRRQAVRICRPLEFDGGVSARVKACREEVRRNAVEAVDAPLVAALHREDETRLAAR
jgi:UrcA family protein